MGFSHSTLAFYGAHVPREKYQTPHQFRETDWLDGVVASLDTPAHLSLGYVTAGDYDRDELFICCSKPFDLEDPETHIEVALGTFRRYSLWTGKNEQVEWDKWLTRLAKAAGYEDLGPFGWIVVPDCS